MYFDSNIYFANYESLPQNTYQKYFISEWIETVFKIKK